MDATATSSRQHAAAAPAERRRHQRVGTMWMATLQSTGALYECMVIDLSRGGAKLMLPHEQPMAEIRALAVGGFATLRAKLAWQRGAFVGVQFLDPPETVAATFRNMLP